MCLDVGCWIRFVAIFADSFTTPLNSVTQRLSLAINGAWQVLFAPAKSTQSTPYIPWSAADNDHKFSTQRHNSQQRNSTSTKYLNLSRTPIERGLSPVTSEVYTFIIYLTITLMPCFFLNFHACVILLIPVFIAHKLVRSKEHTIQIKSWNEQSHKSDCADTQELQLVSFHV